MAPSSRPKPTIGDADSTPIVHGLTINDLQITTAAFTGASARFEQRTVTHRRVLDRAPIRRQLPTPPPRARWHLRLSTFDLNSPKELPATGLDTRGLRAAERALLTRSPGGSSQLGPALRNAETTRFEGRRILVVLSDFELYDPDPTQVLHELTNSSADSVLALVFRSPTPPALAGTRVQIAQIDPHTSVPAEIAQQIVTTACDTLRGRPQPVSNEDVLIDLLDDESGSMWSGNDAFFLRHEAALIAVEHLASRQPPLRRKATRS